jgi:glycosyltransferase involved in cell wall biosynthesis
MKIALICSNSGSGGLIKYIQGFLQTQTEHTLRLFCGTTLPIGESDFVEVVRTEHANESGLDLLLGRPLSQGLIELVDDFAPDAVIFMNGFMRKGLEKYPCLSVLHNQLAVDLGLLLKQRPYRLVASLLAVRKAVLYSFGAADGMIFLSEASKKQADQKGYHYRDGRTILFGQEVEKAAGEATHAAADDQAASQAPHACRELVYASTYFPYKNHKRLLQAMHKVKERGGTFHLSFIGCKESGALTKQIEKLGLREDVTFCGWMSHEETLRKIREADCYVHASLIESTSNGVLEGVYENSTIVCSGLDVFREALGENAYYFNPKDESDMAEAILRAIEAPIRLTAQQCEEILAPYDYQAGVRGVCAYAEYVAQRQEKQR